MSASARGTLAVHSRPTDAAGGPQPSESDVHALVVCTDARELLDMLGVLTDAGHRTTGVSTYEEARRLLRTRRFNLLVTSLRLGTYNGLSLVLFGRVFGTPIPSLVIDAYPDHHNEIEALRLGAAYLGGPPSAEELLTSVRDTLRAAAAESSL
jgi:DNA-binding NtrC family response regulator